MLLVGRIKVFADHWELVDKHTGEMVYTETVDILGTLQQTGGWVELPARAEMFVRRRRREE